MQRFTEEVRSLNQGMDGPEHGKELGAMTFPPQTKIVEDHVEDARASGATVLTGGRRGDGPGDWYEPTVLTGVDHSMRVMRDESFGPVVGVMKVRDADEAVRLANDSRYGLAASVFGSTREAEAVARRLEVGTANVNDVLVGFLASDVPMGGWKDSGIGFRHGEYGIKKFVRPESLVITRFGRKREPLYFPYTDKRRQQLRKITQLLQLARLAAPPRQAAPGRSPGRRPTAGPIRRSVALRRSCVPLKVAVEPRASCSNHSETRRSQATSERVLIRT